MYIFFYEGDVKFIDFEIVIFFMRLLFEKIIDILLNENLFFW